MKNNNLNLIVSLANIHLPYHNYKTKRILDKQQSILQGKDTDTYFRLEQTLINDVVGSCVYYNKEIDYNNINLFCDTIISNDKNDKLNEGKKILAVDLRDNEYWSDKGHFKEYELILNNKLITVVKGNFYQFIKSVSLADRNKTYYNF